MATRGGNSRYQCVVVRNFRAIASDLAGDSRSFRGIAREFSEEYCDFRGVETSLWLSESRFRRLKSSFRGM